MSQDRVPDATDRQAREQAQREAEIRDYLAAVARKQGRLARRLRQYVA